MNSIESRPSLCNYCLDSYTDCQFRKISAEELLEIVSEYKRTPAAENENDRCPLAEELYLAKLRDYKRPVLTEAINKPRPSATAIDLSDEVLSLASGAGLGTQEKDAFKELVSRRSQMPEELTPNDRRIWNSSFNDVLNSNGLLDKETARSKLAGLLRSVEQNNLIKFGGQKDE